MPSVSSTAKMMSRNTKQPAARGLPLAKKQPVRSMSVGKRPLQGTRQFVSMAMSRSLGDSIIRQAVTPAALQPKPMHMVRALSGCEVQFHCFRFTLELEPDVNFLIFLSCYVFPLVYFNAVYQFE